MGHNLSNPGIPQGAAPPPKPEPALGTPTPSSPRNSRPPTVDLPTKRRRKQGRGGKPRRDNRKSRYDADYTGDDERHNANFEAYYREQGIVADDEFERFLKTLAAPLPTSFRIAARDRFRGMILSKMKGEMRELFERVKAGGVEEGGIKPPESLVWYPEGLAWTVSAPRQMLRRENVLSPFHKFLVEMNDLGAINRQESVSMIPPLMLDAQKGDSVIDLCAAPGSKTAQILETVGGGELDCGGIVVANDADIKRCWMLAHQLKRFGSVELVVTNHDAQFFPKVMSFDRVLCDVPCTGDGTMRKAPDIWRRWNWNMGIGIHRLQRAILERGVEICKPGGRVVYSTCSMNPLENEAVVAHALRKYGDDIELLDVSDMLPGLKRRPGLRKWKVKDNSGKVENGGEVARDEKEGVVLNAENEEGIMDESKGDDKAEKQESSGWFEEFSEVPMRRRKKIVSSLFPPSSEELESGKFPLQRCLRLVPHDQDTGAFFVGVFVKKKDAKVARKMARIEAEDSDKDKVIENGKDDDEKTKEIEEKGGNDGVDKDAEIGKQLEEQDAEKQNGEDREIIEDKRRGNRGSRLITDDPLVSLERLNVGMLERITEYFGIERETGGLCLMTRGNDGDKFKKVVVVSGRVRKLLGRSLGSLEGKNEKELVLRVVNAGVRILERTDRRDTICPFRLIYDGVEVVRGMMKERVVGTSNLKCVVRLVKEETVKLEELECGRLREELNGLTSGSCLIDVNVGNESLERLVVWKGKANVALVMPKEHIRAVGQRLDHFVQVLQV